MITRFAPSPTGYLHLGHARAAYEAFEFAKRHGGQCLLRIEDIDHTRCRKKYIDSIYEDLEWLGFSWSRPVRLQSAHVPEYRSVIARLKSMGLVYPCRKTRAEIRANMISRGLSVYIRDPNDTLPQAVGDGPLAWRLSISACQRYLGADFQALAYREIGMDGAARLHPANAAKFGDIIVGRKDIGVSYHIAVTHDDALQAVTHIVRGEDLKEETGVHVLLQKLMGWPTPVYHHHALVLREDGQKLSKRDADPSIRTKRTLGLTPHDIWNDVL